MDPSRPGASLFFFFNDPAPTEIYPLSLHDALPISAKAIAYVRRLPLLAVNHLEGHLRSVWLEHPAAAFPAVSLIASGGHTRSDPTRPGPRVTATRSEEHTSELQSRLHLVCRLLLEK